MDLPDGSMGASVDGGIRVGGASMVCGGSTKVVVLRPKPAAANARISREKVHGPRAQTVGRLAGSATASVFPATCQCHADAMLIF